MPFRKIPLKPATLLAVVAALLITLALALDLTPLLRGGAGWRWPYEVPSQPARLLPGVLALVAYLGVGGWWLARLTQRPADDETPHAFIACCLVGGLGVQLAFLAFYGPPIEQLFLRTVSTLSGGFYEVGVDIGDVLAFLRAYPDLMPGWTAHPSAHPPGIVLSFWGARRVFEWLPGLADRLAGVFRPWQCHHRVLMARSDAAIGAAVLGMALPMLGLLSLWPAYDLARRAAGREAALRTVLWLPLLPAYVMFTPQWNQFHVLPTVAGLWLAHRALTRLKPLPFALAGLVASLATFLSFSNVNLLGVLGVYALVYLALVGRHTWTRRDWRTIAVGAALFVAGLASVWLVFYALSGHTPFDLLASAITTHYGLREPYLPWLLLFPLDLSLFSGLVLAILAAVEAARAVRDAVARRGEPHPGAVLPVTLLICVLGLDFSGVARGEVGRLMLFLMPLIVIVAAQALAANRSDGADTWAVGLVLGVQLVVMVAFLRVIGTGLASPPAPPFVDQSPPAQFAAQARFDDSAGGQADLIGYDVALAPSGDALDLTLYWRSVARFDHAYFVGAVVIGPDGAPLGMYDWLPVDGGYPTSCWRPGEVIADHATIPLDAAPPGGYWLSVSLFDFDTRERLAVSVPGLDADTQVGLGPVPIP
jgi:hypothetical protein